MIALAPNQRLEVIATTDAAAPVRIRYAFTVNRYEADETRDEWASYIANEQTASDGVRVAIPTEARTVQRCVATMIVAAGHDDATEALKVTLQCVTVPPTLVGMPVPAEIVEILDAIDVPVGACIEMVAYEAAWRVRPTATTGVTVSAAMAPVVTAATLPLARAAFGISAAMDPVVTAATTAAGRSALGISAAMDPVSPPRPRQPPAQPWGRGVTRSPPPPAAPSPAPSPTTSAPPKPR